MNPSDYAFYLAWWRPADAPPDVFKLEAVSTQLHTAKAALGSKDGDSLITSSRWLPFEITRCFEIPRHRAQLHGREVQW